MKMSINHCLVLLFCFLNLLGSAQPNRSHVSEEKQPNVTLQIDSIIGEYSGIFFGSELQIVLQTLENGKVTGFDEHKNIRRQVQGTYTLESNNLKLTLNEPGDHKFDGIITLQIDTRCFCGTGTWKSYKGNKEHPIEKIHKQLPTKTKGD